MALKILNLGCGNSTYGTDFVDLYPMRRDVVQCDISREKLPYKDGTFDVVFSSFVFEHLVCPQFTLKEMYRVLKKGGRVEIHTNNAGWLFYHNTKSKVKTHYGGYERAGKDKTHAVGGHEDRHYALYTFHHMANHLEEVGFTKIKTQLYQRNKHSWWWGIRLMNWLLEHSRFSWAAYPQIKAEGVK